MMTKQEIFETSVRGIISQGGPSFIAQDNDGFNNILCRYRGPDGRKCAAGWFIPDDRYTKDLEGVSWCSTGLADEVGHEKLVSDLQLAHDNAAEVSNYAGPNHEDFWVYWREELYKVAMAHGLDKAVLDEIPDSE